jgi:mono/diheme cytochrome c family protein
VPGSGLAWILRTCKGKNTFRRRSTNIMSGRRGYNPFMISSERVITLGILLGLFTVPLFAAERPIMQSRVPEDKLAEARSLTNPLLDSPQIIEQGKALYEGKGTCFNCHGTDGRGNGPAATGLNPSPRNFHHHGFWRHRTEGEIFWVVKHGIAGTAMIPFAGTLTDEEIWAIIQYEHTFTGAHGPADSTAPHHGKGPRSSMGGMASPEGGCCDRRE